MVELNAQEILDLLSTISLSNFNERDAEDQMTFLERDVFPSEYGDITFKSGVSKAVLIPENTDFVIKIPYCGSLECYDEGDVFEQFVGAEGNSCDYCKTELFRYETAVQNEYDAFFLPLKFIGYSGENRDYPIYVQPKAETESDRYLSDWDTPPDNYPQDIYDTQEVCKTYNYNFPLAWISHFIQKYGKQILFELCQYLNQERIYDLHSDNIGYDKDDNPIIIDYAGFDS